MHQTSTKKQIQCPYIDSVKRHLLDFDLEQICSVTLSNINVYCCLVCGRSYQGKGVSTTAYEHSIEFNHQLFINLKNEKIYCLPELYEVDNPKLNDIKFNLNPKYQAEDLKKLNHFQTKYNIDGKQYIPGIIGINNLKGTDYVSSVLQVLNAVKPFRQYFLLSQRFQDVFLDKFGLFFKKLWNYKQFKGFICPHQLMHAISEKSMKKYRVGQKADPLNFLVWLVDNLQKSLKKQKRKKVSLSYLFQGHLKTSYIKGIKNSSQYESIPTKVQDKPFLFIKLEFPQKGIFNRVENHIDLKQLLIYYIGEKGKVQGQGLLFIKIMNFPRYLILSFKRFKKNQFNVEKDTSTLLYTGDIEIQSHKYKLVSQVCHTGSYEKGSYKSHMMFNQKWFQAEDLHINEVLKKQMLLGEPYLQIYEKQE